MCDLQHFSNAVASAVVNSGYSISGVAKVEQVNGSILYSASLVSNNKHAARPRAVDVSPRFQAVPVCGFTFSSCEVLEFLSDIPMPKPLWRVQNKYHKQI